LLPKRIALPVFASDALSSVAYAPQEIFLVLSLAGVSFLPLQRVDRRGRRADDDHRRPRPIGRTCTPTPAAVGDYEVATTNLGVGAGVTVAAALLVDYVLTVAVSVSAGVDNLGSAVPFVVHHRLTIALGLVVLLAPDEPARGARVRHRLRHPHLRVSCSVWWRWSESACSAKWCSTITCARPPRITRFTRRRPSVTGFALFFLLLRAFSSGLCRAHRRPRPSANGVPAFKEGPSPRTPRDTLVMMGGIAVTMFAGLVALGLMTHARLAEHPDTDVLINGVPGRARTTNRKPIIAQVCRGGVRRRLGARFVYLAGVTAFDPGAGCETTAFNGFPVLASILSRDELAPKQLHRRGDRLTFSKRHRRPGRDGGLS